jgi:2-dehydro-3-deoxyphosphogluconate aldolase / (4S)-4-hydroxy-2-oxoglutarate aldolase
MTGLDVLARQQVMAVVRAPRVRDPLGLVETLHRAGVSTVEFTFTTPDVLDVLRAASGHGSALVGAGTVLSEDQAGAATAAGARFLVTPCLRPPVAAVAAGAGVPLVMGALSPTEVAAALDLGVDAVKIFPARAVGPAYLTDLHGPFPGSRLIPSGGIDHSNARAFLDRGAFAVSAGSVAPADLVADGRHDAIRERTARFVAALRPPSSG